jgi:hypothetical protein
MCRLARSRHAPNGFRPCSGSIRHPPPMRTAPEGCRARCHRIDSVRWWPTLRAHRSRPDERAGPPGPRRRGKPRRGRAHSVHTRRRGDRRQGPEPSGRRGDPRRCRRRRSRSARGRRGDRRRPGRDPGPAWRERRRHVSPPEPPVADREGRWCGWPSPVGRWWRGRTPRRVRADAGGARSRLAADGASCPGENMRVDAVDEGAVNIEEQGRRATRPRHHAPPSRRCRGRSAMRAV